MKRSAKFIAYPYTPFGSLGNEALVNINEIVGEGAKVGCFRWETHPSS